MNVRKLAAKAAENWLAKVISIALAVGLFVFNQLSNLEERFFSAPLRVEMDGELAPASSYPRMVRIGLRGEANSIVPILEEDVEAYLDLSKYTQEGSYRAPVQIRKKGTALGVDPLEISVDPLEVFLELDEKVGKYMPLNPKFQGVPEPGYELVSYSITPSQVMVEGPARLMEHLSGLPTDMVELGGRSDDFTLLLRIQNPDPLLHIQGDGMTEFRGFVKNLIIIRDFEDLPLGIQNLHKDLIAEPEIHRGSLRLKGAQKDLENYGGGDLALNLDCGSILEPGTYHLSVQAEFPSAFTLVRSDPAEILVNVTRRHEEEAP